MGFILRTIIKDGSNHTEVNRTIGESYQVINRESNYEEFQKLFKESFGKDHVADLDDNADNYTKNTYAILIVGAELVALYKKQFNYIMTGNGQTFSNLTYREGKAE